MPFYIKLKLALGLISGTALIVLAALLSANISLLLPVCLIAASACAAVYATFVFYPKFDPTGTTVWKGPLGERTLALTFDDGPSEHTASVLDALASRGVRATFFFLSENASKLPGLVDRARSEGHAIGNHGSSHMKMHTMNAGQIEREIVGCEEVLGAISSGGGRKIMRVPHGFKSIALVRTARRLGYTLVGWTSGVWDSDRPGVKAIVQRSIEAVKPGCILLLHDGDGVRPDADRSQTAEALPRIIDYCLMHGYKFVTIPQILDMKRGVL
ncbi:MAG: polysaccharide deacetylase family protein [Myxococcota bacterium]|jgi:peptidoglycan/xylan/chitin deacetylase (PgdA/CDA1 family)